MKMRRRSALRVLGLALPSLTLAGAARGQEDEAERPPVPAVRRLRGLTFTSPLLRDARESLRPTATALHPLGEHGHHYEQRGFVGRRARGAVDLALGAMRAWGHPAPLDTTWYEEARSLAVAPGGAAAWLAATCALWPSDQPDERPAEERAAVAAHAEAMRAAVEARTGLELVGMCCGWADASGALAHGLGIVDPSTREIYWSYLVETWAP